MNKLIVSSILIIVLGSNFVFAQEWDQEKMENECHHTYLSPCGFA